MLHPVVVVKTVTDPVLNVEVSTVLPMHIFTENAASTDLLTTEEDGEFFGWCIATWRTCRVETSYLMKEVGSLSSGTTERLGKLLQGVRDWTLRPFTGAVLAKFDSRNEFRKWFLKETNILRVKYPAEYYE